MVPSHGFSPRSYFFDNPRRYDSDDDLAWNAAPQGLQGRYTPVPTGPGQGVGPYQWAEPGPQVFAGAGGEAGRRPAPRVCARPTAATQRRLSGVGSRASPRSSAGHPRGAGCPGRPPLAATRWHSALPRSPLSLARGHRRGGSSWLTAAHQVLSACPRALCHPWEGRCRARAS